MDTQEMADMVVYLEGAKLAEMAEMAEPAETAEMAQAVAAVEQEELAGILEQVYQTQVKEEAAEQEELAGQDCLAQEHPVVQGLVGQQAIM